MTRQQTNSQKREEKNMAKILCIHELPAKHSLRFVPDRFTLQRMII